MERKVLMRIATSWLLLAQVGCGGDSKAMTNAAQSGTGTGGPPAVSTSVSTTPSTAAKSTPSTSTTTAAAGAAAMSATSSTTSSTAPKAGSAATTTTTMTSAGGAGKGATTMSPDGTPSSGRSDTGSAGSKATATAGSGAAGSGSTGNSAGSCLDGITGYDKDGPFMVEPKVEGAVNVWIPKVPAGCKVPIIHLANGTGANCAVYAEALNRMATHGFLATCFEDPNTGSGQDGLMAFKQTLEMHQDIADMKFGSTGHSQGGQAAFTGLQLAEAEWGDKAIYAGLAMEPASGFGIQPAMPWPQVYAMIKSPMFMFSGLGTDGLVSQAWVQSAYDALSMTDEAYFWTAAGATHIPVPNGEEEEISIPWFRWKLLGDQEACKYFKAIPMKDTRWNEVASKNAQDCK